MAMGRFGESSPDSSPYYVDYLSVFGYQFTSNSRLEVMTKAGEYLEIKKLNAETMPLIERQGEIVVIDVSSFRPNTRFSVADLSTGRQADIFRGQTYLVVSEADNKSLIGSFGPPFGGLNLNRIFNLYGQFGISSGAVKSLRGQLLLPDFITARAGQLVEQYAERLPGDLPLKDQLASDMTRIRDIPGLFLRDDSTVDPQVRRIAHVQKRVQTMIRDLCSSLLKSPTLPFDRFEMEELTMVFHTLIMNQCYDPEAGSVRVFKQPFRLREDPDTEPRHRLSTSMHLDGEVETFHVKFDVPTTEEITG